MFGFGAHNQLLSLQVLLTETENNRGHLAVVLAGESHCLTLSFHCQHRFPVSLSLVSLRAL